MSENPFRTAPGSQPPLLAGRDAEIELIRYGRRLTVAGAAAQPLILSGLRGMGKTALLRRCTLEAGQEGNIVLYAEGSHYQGLGELFRRSLETAKADLESLPSKLRDAVGAAIRALPKASIELPHDMGGVSLETKREEKPQTPLIDAIVELNSAAHKHKRCLVIAIDEIQMVPISQIEPIVALVQDSAAGDAPIYFVGAGLPNSRAHLKQAKTYTERWRYARLELLGTEDTGHAISEPLARQKIHIDDDALAYLVKETHGYPFFIQEYGTAAWTVARALRVTKASLEEVTKGVRKMLDDSLYGGTFETLTDRELHYVFAMVASGTGPYRVGDIAQRLSSSSESLSWIRNQLVKKDVIFSPGPGLIEFRLPLTNSYVRRHRNELSRRMAPKKP